MQKKSRARKLHTKPRRTPHLIPQPKRPNTKTVSHLIPVPQSTETIAHTIYDTFTMLPEQERESIYLLVVPLGAERKTEVDTNMFCPGYLPYGQSFHVESIYLDFLNSPAMEDKRQFLRSYSFELLIATKTYFQCIATDLCAEELGTNGFKSTPNRAFRIDGGQHFCAHFKRQYPAPLDRYGKGIRVRLLLNGWLTRSLQ